MKTNYLDTVDNARLRANNEEEDIIYDDSRKSSFDKNATSIKDVILPSGIDATSYNHLEIFAKTTKYCRSFYVSSVPRMLPHRFLPVYQSPVRLLRD